MTWADPESAFAELSRRHDRMFWLDGGGSRDWSGRRSIIGWLEPDDVSLTYSAAERQVWRVAGGRREPVGEDIFTVLEQELARDGGDPRISWVGWFGYASRADLPARTDPSGAVPDAVWMRAPRRLVFTHPDPSGGSSQRGAAASPAEAGASPFPTPADAPGTAPAAHRSGHPAPGHRSGRRTPDRAEYDAWFARVQEQLRLGNSYEVNLTYREIVASDTDPVTAYLRLRALNPAPYAAFLRHHGVTVLSSSPERFATVDRRRWVQTKPIKGTTPRGADAVADEANRVALGADPRYRAENLMIVDLLRNDLSMVCEPGTVTVPHLMEVESYASVHQLVSTVRGRLRPEVGTIAALRALFPAGSMTGAPKLRTMEIIADVETTPRGIYAGALGWIGGDGRADLGVVIRTLVAHDGEYTLGTGGGITVRSDAGSEYDETRWKAHRLLQALG